MFPTPTSAIYSGESETWRVVNVKISTGEQQLNFGEGKLQMKGQSAFLANYFKLSAHVVIKNKEENNSRMHEYELMAGNLPITWEKDELDIAEMDTGRSSPIFLTKYWKPVTMGDIKQVYIIVQWEGENDNELKEEKIILTSPDL